MHRQLAEHGVHHAWIEGDNLDMAFPVPWKQGYPLAEANLAAMWSNYKAHGYERLIYVNTASVIAPAIDELATAMGDHPTVTGVLLTSSDEVAEQRLVQREVGGALTTRWDEVVRPLVGWKPRRPRESSGSTPMDGQ